MIVLDYAANFIIALADLVNWIIVIWFLIGPLAFIYEVHKRVKADARRNFRG